MSVDISSIKKHDVVVRYDPNQIVIWSLENDRYYVPTTNEAKSALNTLLSRKKAGESIYDGMPDRMIKDFKYLGFNGSVREVHSTHEMPFDVYFDFTWKCNLNCSYCYNREVDRCTTMEPEKVRHVFHEMWKNGIMRVHVAGGEPFLDPNGLRNYLEGANSYGIGDSVTCNGTLLTEPLCEMIFNNEVRSLTFSIDGHTADIHDEFRGAGAFKRTIAGIKLAVLTKRKSNASTVIQSRTAWTPTTPHKNIEKIVNLAIELGIDIVQFHSPERCEFHPKGYYGRPENIEGYYNGLFYIKRLKQKYEDKIEIWHTLNPLVGCGKIGVVGKRGCIGGQELLALQPNGDIAPCLMNLHSFGNFFKDWDGDLARFIAESENLRDFHQLAQSEDPECDRCELHNYCRGGSRVRIKVEYDDLPHKRDPLCPKDYLKKNPAIKPRLISSHQINFFEPLAIVHSL